MKAGYARNYLIPKGKATLATSENVAKFESQRAELMAKAEDELVRAQGRAKLLEDKAIVINAKAGVEGKLFGSVGTLDIVKACDSLGAPVERSEVRLPDGPIRLVGEHKVELHLHTDVNVELVVRVEASSLEEESDLEEEPDGLEVSD